MKKSLGLIALLATAVAAAQSEANKQYVLLPLDSKSEAVGETVCGRYFTLGKAQVVTYTYDHRMVPMVFGRERFVILIDEKKNRPTVSLFPGSASNWRLVFRMSYRDFLASRPCLPEPTW